MLKLNFDDIEDASLGYDYLFADTQMLTRITTNEPNLDTIIIATSDTTQLDTISQLEHLISNTRYSNHCVHTFVSNHV